MKIHHLFSLVTLMQISLFGATKSSQNQVVSPSENFEGVRFAAGVGYGGILLHSNRSGPKPKSSTSYGAHGVAVQTKLGYDIAFCERWLFGFSAYGQYNSAKTENHFFESSTTSSGTDRTFSLPWNLGLDLRLGIAPTNNSLLFIFGGIDWGYYNFHYVTTGINQRLRQFKAGGLLGAGLEQALTDNWFVAVTVDYRWYGTEKMSYSNDTTQSIQARLATGLFTFGYRF